VSDKSADKSARSVGERGRRTRRLPREDPRAEVGEDVRVGVGPIEFKLYRATQWQRCRRHVSVRLSVSVYQKLVLSQNG